jgi:hypothetical protein
MIEATKTIGMKASGILRRLADHRAPVALCAARKNMADTPSEAA